MRPFRFLTTASVVAMTLAACASAPRAAPATEPSPPAKGGAPASQPGAPATGRAPATGAAVFSPSNPFAHPSTLPFQAPPFDKIKDSDYQPALEEGMRQQLAEVRTIADDPAPPTFANTFVALEKSGQMLTRVSQVFNAVSGANTNPTLQKLQEEEAPKLAAHQDAIFLDSALFRRIEAVRASPAIGQLDAESQKLVDYIYKEFVHAGARLSDADKARLKKLNEEESTLDAQFVNLLLAATKAGALVVDDEARLAGLTQGEIDAAAQAAKDRDLQGRWVIPLQNTTQQPLLRSLSDRSTREKLFEASWTRAERGDANDTRAIIARIAQIRAQQASLLGFPDYAAWKLEDQMAKTPERALRFMDELVAPATGKARVEGAAIQAAIEETGQRFQLAPWDWELYAEQVRKARYDLDENEIKPYFELDRVLRDGVFYAANQLYGLTFLERHDLPVYQPDVRVFEVFDKDGSPLALFYADYFKRDNKNGGAWMDNLVGQSKLLGKKPVIYNVANFTKPAPGQPALLSYSDVTTMFHEFGHGLHGIFASQQYPSLSGTAVARDFVEFPSQFNEHWALYPEVLAHYAKQYQTGAPMPQALVEKIKRAKTFNQGYALTEVLAAALLDMSWHTLPATAPLQNADAFETQSLRSDHIDLPTVPPRYRSSYFMHIWGNGYAAGYYAYLWTEMLDDDAYQWFTEHGGLTRANGDRFRAMILSRGNTEDLDRMYRDFRGRAPSIEPMLEQRGLKEGGAGKGG